MLKVAVIKIVYWYTSKKYR